jgi:hypothetical protein
MAADESVVFWLRVAYWVGAVFDALTIIPMLCPTVGARVFGLSSFEPGPEYRYAMSLAAALMLGWTVLLIWANRKPLERHGVLPVTVVVIVGLAAAGGYAVLAGVVSLGRMVPLWIWQSILAVFFTIAYRRSREAGRRASALRDGASSLLPPRADQPLHH